jgi:glucose 1-dehydrogenase
LLRSNFVVDQTVIITGASRGIGLATAKAFARQNYNVVINARDTEALAVAAEQVHAILGSCLPVAGDVGDPAFAEQLVKAANGHYGNLRALVNNAGAAPMATAADMSLEQFDTCLSANIKSTFYMTRAAWKHLTAGGVIVNLSSVSAIDPFPGLGVYGASKAWVEKFTAACAAEGKVAGVRVFAIGPGAVETKMLREVAPGFPADNALDPADIASAIVALTQSHWQHSSGQTIYVRK